MSCAEQSIWSGLPQPTDRQSGGVLPAEVQGTSGTAEKVIPTKQSTFVLVVDYVKSLYHSHPKLTQCSTITIHFIIKHG